MVATVWMKNAPSWEPFTCFSFFFCLLSFLLPILILLLCWTRAVFLSVVYLDFDIEHGHGHLALFSRFPLLIFLFIFVFKWSSGTVQIESIIRSGIVCCYRRMELFSQESWTFLFCFQDWFRGLLYTVLLAWVAGRELCIWQPDWNHGKDVSSKCNSGHLYFQKIYICTDMY